MSLIKNLLASNSFWVLNKAIVQELRSLEAGAFLTVLADKYAYHESNNELIKSDGLAYFYATSEHIESLTFINYRGQKKLINLLEERGLITTKLMSVPAKLHFHICENKILQIVKTSFAESAKLDLQKAENINKEHNTNNILSNNTAEKSFSTDMFGNQEKTLFRDSTANSKTVIEKKFAAEIEAGVDVKYYVTLVKDWNDKLPTRTKTQRDKALRNANGWIATIRDFMRSDQKKGTLKKVGQAAQVETGADFFKRYQDR